MLKSFIKNCLFGVNLRVTKAKTLLAAHDQLFEYSLGHNLIYVYASLYILEQLPPWGIVGDGPNPKCGVPSDPA